MGLKVIGEMLFEADWQVHAMQAANILYFDQPAGTGLSWSEDPDDYNTNDTNAQADMHQAMLQWFETYTYFSNHEFYITDTPSRAL